MKTWMYLNLILGLIKQKLEFRRIISTWKWKQSNGKRSTRITQSPLSNSFLDSYLNTSASSSSWISPQNFIFHTLAENSQVLPTISYQVMCKILVLLNEPLVVTLYILMSIRRVNLIMEEIMLCHLWFRLSKRWVIFLIPVWESSPFVQMITEVRTKIELLYSPSFVLLRLYFFQKKIYFSMYGGHTKNASYHLLNILKMGYHKKYIHAFKDAVEVFGSHEKF